jgi:hypothetical protein
MLDVLVLLNRVQLIFMHEWVNIRALFNETSAKILALFRFQRDNHVENHVEDYIGLLNSTLFAYYT